MKNSTLLATTAVVAVVAVAGIGGYLVDRQSSQTEVAAVSGATPQIVAPPGQTMTKQAAIKPAVKPVVRDTAVATAKPSPPVSTSTRETINDNDLVAMSGTVTSKKGSVMMLKDAKGMVRVVVREDTPRPWDVGAPLAMDKVDVGDKVTVYGKVRTGEDLPKVYADAVYDAGTKTLYYINPSRQPEATTTAAITAPYTPVRGAATAHITATKVAVTK